MPGIARTLGSRRLRGGLPAASSGLRPHRLAGGSRFHGPVSPRLAIPGGNE